MSKERGQVMLVLFVLIAVILLVTIYESNKITEEKETLPEWWDWDWSDCAERCECDPDQLKSENETEWMLKINDCLNDCYRCGGE